MPRHVEYLRTGRWPRRAAAPFADRPIPKNVKHGTIYCYQQYGCSCKPCKDAASANDRQYRARRAHNRALNEARGLA